MRKTGIFMLMLAMATSPLTADDAFTPCSEHKYQGSACVIAAVYQGDQRMSGCEVGAFAADGECRGHEFTRTEFNDKAYLSIMGEGSGTSISFKVAYQDGQGNQQIVTCTNSWVYEDDAVLGTPDEPYRLFLPVSGSVDYVDAVTPSTTGTFTTDELSNASALANASQLTLHGTWSSTEIQSLNTALTGGNANMILADVVLASDFAGSVENAFAGCLNLTAVKMSRVPATTANAFANANPNCIVWIDDANAVAPTGWTNVVANGKALTDITLRNGSAEDGRYCPYACPKTITLGAHKAIFIYEHHLWATGSTGWNTLVLPFAAQMYADGEKQDIYTSLNVENASSTGFWCMQLTASTNDGHLTFTSLSAYSILSAHVPYLVALPGANFGNLSLEGKTITFVSTGSSIGATTDENLSNTSDAQTFAYGFYGTYQTINDADMFLLASSTKAGQSDSFVRKEHGKLLPFRGYMTGNGAGNNAPALYLDFSEETSIEEIATRQEAPEAYDLLGRAATPSHRGFTVENGKLILIR